MWHFLTVYKLCPVGYRTYSKFWMTIGRFFLLPVNFLAGYPKPTTIIVLLFQSRFEITLPLFLSIVLNPPCYSMQQTACSVLLFLHQSNGNYTLDLSILLIMLGRYLLHM